jgi:hypothetical protein
MLNEFPVLQDSMSLTGYSISAVYIIGQFYKLDSISLEAKIAASPKGRIWSYILCCYRIK